MNKDSFNPIRGFKDTIDKNFAYATVYNICLQLAKLNGYFEAIMPYLEQSSLFERNLGDESDINLKELYKFSFYDDNLALRPEFTAGIARMISSMSNFLGGHEYKHGLNLFSFGAVFRHDRPQAGRYRQFYQANFECFKNDSILCDTNNILLACNVIETLNTYSQNNNNTSFMVELNSLGSSESKAKYSNILQDYFAKYTNDLSPDSKIRLEKNPIRILDSKDENDKKLIANAPQIKDAMTEEENTRIKTIAEILSQNLSSKFVVKLDQSLVRGLDYYTSTVFEIKPIKADSKNSLSTGLTITAGGRYDGLINSISAGRHNCPAFGFAFGVERLIEFFNLHNLQNNKDESAIHEGRFNNAINLASNDLKLAVVSLDLATDCIAYSVSIKQELAKKGYVCILLQAGKSISKIINDLSDEGFDCVVFVGKNECESKTHKIKTINKHLSQEQKQTFDIAINKL